MKQSVYDQSLKHYSEHYEEIIHYLFEDDRKNILKDPADDSASRCRFCKKVSPDVSFKITAHAVPEFLGNRDIISLNECDTCNEFFASNYEDHLSKWSMFARATSQLRGKRGKPKFKNPDGTLKVKSGDSGLNIELTDPDLFKQIATSNEPFKFQLPVDASSQNHVPVNAAKALVKAACSVCPSSELEQCAPTIDWLMHRVKASLSDFPVLYGFTPGPLSNNVSEIRLIRRRTDAPMPYLWCVIQFGHHRLQTFVPFCIQDQNWLTSGKPSTFTMHHYPSRFGTDWEFGEEEYRRMDWSRENVTHTTATASFQVNEWIRITSPAESGGNTR